MPLYPPGALRQGRPGAQPAGKLCGHPFAAQRAAALLSAIRGRQGRDAVPPVRRGGVHPVRLLRDGRGEHRPLYRCGGGHRGTVHQRGHLPTADAGKRLCALLRLPDDGRALFRYHVDDAADFVHERRPAAGNLSDRRACQDRRRGPPHDPRPDGKVHGLCPRGGEPDAQILCAGGLGAAVSRRRAGAGQAKAAGAGKGGIRDKKQPRSVRRCSGVALLMLRKSRPRPTSCGRRRRRPA